MKLQSNLVLQPSKRNIVKPEQHALTDSAVIKQNEPFDRAKNTGTYHFWEGRTKTQEKTQETSPCSPTGHIF